MKSLDNLRVKRVAIIIACGISLAPQAAGQQTRRPGPSDSAVTVIEGATLIDGNGGTPLKNSVIVIDGSRIRVVGAKGSVSYPAGAAVIKADGLTALPGLIDAHIHSLNFFPQLFLHFGITTRQTLPAGSSRSEKAWRPGESRDRVCSSPASLSMDRTTPKIAATPIASTCERRTRPA